MKRANNLFESLISSDNLVRAANNALRNKRKNKEIIEFENNYASKLQQLYNLLTDSKYKPGEYRQMTIYEPKERQIMIAPFYPDRIVHQAIVNIIEPIWSKLFIHHTYACIKGKGIHACMLDVSKALKSNKKGTAYCLKFDIKKYFDSIDRNVLKSICGKTIKDNRFLNLLYEIIDAVPGKTGIPIGNYISQYFANLYLTYFDHYCKEELSLKHYYRYMDDVVILSSSKEHLHDVFEQIRIYLDLNLNLTIKGNYQIFPVLKRQIDFVGYRMDHNNIMLRKRILQNAYKTAQKQQLKSEEEIKHAMPSHWGWLQYIDNSHRNFIINKMLCQN